MQPRKCHLLELVVIDEDDLAYAAGYLDGEGCFYVGRNWKISIACETTHRATIEWLQWLFGGSVTENKIKKKAQWRPTYRWSVVARNARLVCNLLVPYLHEKTQQALLLIMLHQTMSTEPRVSAETAAERDRLAALVKGLKRVRS